MKEGDGAGPGVSVFPGTQAVLVAVVLVLLLNTQGCVGIAFPATAQIKYIVDTSDAVFPGESQS